MENVPKFIAGRYEIADRIGQGGMGSLYRARDTVLERIVAIKVLRDGFDNEELRQRFVREARSAARLSHRNIVTVHDFGEYLGQPYIVMEFIPGETLAHMIRAQKPLPLGLKLQYMEDLCVGLFHAHKAGIVHRDIKPANVIVDEEGVLKILDFGIARLGESSMTMGGILGTLNYMSPEQIAGNVDHRSDIFAVGALFYELLCFKQAFPGSMESGVLHRILNNAPEPLGQFCPNLDPEIERIVFQALEKNPSRRYPDLGVMRKDLARVRTRFVEVEPPTDDAVETVVAHTPVPTPVAQTPVPTPATPRTPKRGSDRDMLAKLRTQQIEAQLKTAQEAFDAGNHDAALAAVEQALVLDPDGAGARTLQEKIRAAIEAQEIQASLDSAKGALAQADLTGAQRWIDDALAKGAAAPAVAGLQRAVADARRKREDEQRRQEELEQHVSRGRQDLSQGSYDAAAAAADRALQIDARNAEALSLKREAQQALEAARRTAEEQRRAEEERKRAEAAVEKARRQFAAGDHQPAIAILEPLADRFPFAAAALQELRGELSEIQRRQREEEALAAKQRAVAQHLQTARAALDASRFDDAIREVQQAQRLDPGAEGAADLMQAALDAQAVAEAEAARRRELDELMKVAADSLRQGKLSVAKANIDAALALDESNAAARDLSGRIAAAIERDREKQALDRRAREQIASAEAMFDGGQHREALGLLEGFTPRHDEVSAAIGRLRGKLEAVERARRDEEARLKAEAERREAEQRLREGLDRSRALLARSDVEGAIELLRTLRQTHPDSRELSQLLDQATAAKRAADAAAERERQVQAKLEDAEERLGRQDFRGALKRATAALAIVPDHPAALALRARIERDQEAKRTADEQAKAAEERARRVSAGVKKAGKARSNEAAVAILRELRALAPDDAEVTRLLALREAAWEQEKAGKEQQDLSAGPDEPTVVRGRPPLDGAGIAHLPALENAREWIQGAYDVTLQAARTKPLHAALSVLVVAVIIGAWLLLSGTGEEPTPNPNAGTIALEEPSTGVSTPVAENNAPAFGAAADAPARGSETASTQVVTPPPVSTTGTAVQGPLQTPSVRPDPTTQKSSSQPQRPVGPVAGPGSQTVVPRETPPPLSGEEQQMAGFRATALSQLRQGQRQAALATAISGLRIRPQDRDLRNVVDQLAGEADSRMATARAEAVRSRAPELAGDLFRRAEEQHQQGRALLNSGRTGEAVRSFWMAADGFLQATESAERIAAATAAAAPRPPVQPARGTTPVTLEPVPGPVAGPGRTAAPADTARLPEPAPSATTGGTAAPQQPQLSSRATDEAAIRRTLAEYESAYARMDEARLRQINPSYSGVLSRQRTLLNSVRLTFSDVSIDVSPDGATATMRATQNFQYDWKRAGNPRTSSGSITWMFRKVGSVWTVVG